MSNLYCGADKLPKGYKFGNMQECAERKQIRLFGLKRFDPRILKIVKKGEDPATREKLILKLTSLRGLIRRHKGRYETTKDERIRDESFKIWQKAEKDIKPIIAKLKKIEAQKKVIQEIKKKKVVPKKKKTILFSKKKMADELNFLKQASSQLEKDKTQLEKDIKTVEQLGPIIQPKPKQKKKYESSKSKYVKSPITGKMVTRKYYDRIVKEGKTQKKTSVKRSTKSSQKEVTIHTLAKPDLYGKVKSPLTGRMVTYKYYQRLINDGKVKLIKRPTIEYKKISTKQKKPYEYELEAEHPIPNITITHGKLFEIPTAKPKRLLRTQRNIPMDTRTFNDIIDIFPERIVNDIENTFGYITDKIDEILNKMKYTIDTNSDRYMALSNKLSKEYLKARRGIGSTFAVYLNKNKLNFNMSNDKIIDLLFQKYYPRYGELLTKFI